MNRKTGLKSVFLFIFLSIIFFFLINIVDAQNIYFNLNSTNNCSFFVNNGQNTTTLPIDATELYHASNCFSNSLEIEGYSFFVADSSGGQIRTTATRTNPYSLMTNVSNVAGSGNTAYSFKLNQSYIMSSSSYLSFYYPVISIGGLNNRGKSNIYLYLGDSFVGELQSFSGVSSSCNNCFDIWKANNTYVFDSFTFWLTSSSAFNQWNMTYFQFNDTTLFDNELPQFNVTFNQSSNIYCRENLTDIVKINFSIDVFDLEGDTIYYFVGNPDSQRRYTNTVNDFEQYADLEPLNSNCSKAFNSADAYGYILGYYGVYEFIALANEGSNQAYIRNCDFAYNGDTLTNDASISFNLNLPYSQALDISPILDTVDTTKLHLNLTDSGNLLIYNNSVLVSNDSIGFYPNQNDGLFMIIRMYPNESLVRYSVLDADSVILASFYDSIDFNSFSGVYFDTLEYVYGTDNENIFLIDNVIYTGYNYVPNPTFTTEEWTYINATESGYIDVYVTDNVNILLNNYDISSTPYILDYCPDTVGIDEDTRQAGKYLKNSITKVCSGLDGLQFNNQFDISFCYGIKVLITVLSLLFGGVIVAITLYMMPKFSPASFLIATPIPTILGHIFIIDYSTNALFLCAISITLGIITLIIALIGGGNE